MPNPLKLESAAVDFDAADLLTAARTIAELADRALRRVRPGSEMNPRLLDITDAARYLSMSDKAIRELIANDELCSIQKVPARSPYLIDIRDLDRWIERNKVRAGRITF